MGLWTLKPDELGEATDTSGRNAFIATLVTFFVAEIGDKTQLATVALAAGYSNLLAVVAGTTSGMMLANVPAVLAADAFASRLPIRTIRYAAAAVFAILGIVFIIRAIMHIRAF
jgi:putative Ca2+/H+ antiporter (TMEM165/GDT1 family)